MRQRLPRGQLAERASARGARLLYTGDPAHPDAATIRRTFPQPLRRHVSFEIRGAGREEIFRFMDASSWWCARPRWAMCTP
jgi:cystathionine beta-lyase/cystathionine gamma-synthase